VTFMMMEEWYGCSSEDCFVSWHVSCLITRVVLVADGNTQSGYCIIRHVHVW